MSWLDSVPAKTLWRLFSSATIKALASRETPDVVRELIARNSPVRAPATWRLDRLYESAYSFLSEDRPAEYFYKTALLQKNVLGRGGSRRTRVFFEFRAGGSKLDALVISDHSMHALEIKTDLDHFRRLSSQIADYQSRFSHVWVYSSERHVAALLNSVADEVGVAFLSKARRFEVVREPRRFVDRLESRHILESLQRSEYLDVLKIFGFEPGSLPNTMIFSEAMRFAAHLNPEEVHEATMLQLKRRSQASSMTSLARLPFYLRAGTLAARCGEDEIDALLRVMSKRIGKDLI